MHRNLRQATLSALRAGTMAILASIAPAAAENQPPIYPGSTLVPSQSSGVATPMCGHKLYIVSSYKAPKSVSAKALMTWYHQKMPGATSVDQEINDSTMSAGEFFAADTEWAVTIQQMLPASSTLAAGERMLGADQANIGFVKFDPPLGPALVHLIAAAAGTDKGADAAKATLGKMCPRPEK